MKKIIALILVLIMALSLTSCSQKKTSFVYLYNEDANHKAIGEYIQGALGVVGLDVKLESQEWNTFLNTRKNGEYTIARNGWVGDYNDPISFLDMWISDSGNNDCQLGKGDHANVAIYDLDMSKWGGENVTNGTWAQTYDVLIGMIKKETNEKTRMEMMHTAEDLLMSTGAITPLYYYTDIYMLDESVKGFYTSPLGFKYFHKTTVDGLDYLNVCIASQPDTIDPALNSSIDGGTLVSHLFAGLAKWEQMEDGTIDVAPDCVEELVEGVTNDDGTVTYTYTLKEGLKWSDGVELKASDFEFAWKRAASAELAADYGYMFDVIVGYGTDNKDDLAVASNDAERTITVTLANKVSYWNELMAFPVYYPVREDVVANDSWSTSPETYVSNGAYTLSDWKDNSVITLTKNSNYHNTDIVTMPTLKFYLSDNVNNMLTNFKNGDWLMIDNVPPEEIRALEKDYPNEFFVAGQLGTYYICWNVNADLGVDNERDRAEIRKAIGLLLDRNYICETISKGGEVPASSFVAMGLTEETDEGETEFYLRAGNPEENGYIGYYDVSEDAFMSNSKKAVEILSKYYDLDIKR